MGDYLSHWRRSHGRVQTNYVRVNAQGTDVRTDALRPLFGTTPKPTGWEFNFAHQALAGLVGPPAISTAGITPLKALLRVVDPAHRLWVEHDATWTLWDLGHHEVAQSNPSVFARIKEVLTEVARDFAKPHHHAGTEAVDWLRDFLEVSRDTALAVGQVSSATYYSWKSKPNSAVRPKTVARLLRVTATLRLLERSVGREEAGYLIRHGSPSLLERLQNAGDEFEQALDELAELAAPRVSRRPRRLASQEDALAQLAALEADDKAVAGLRPLGSARELRDDEKSALRDEPTVTRTE